MDDIMNIIIVGCGQVGRTLATQLSAEGHNITVVDTSRERITEITNKIDVMGVVGNGASHATLEDALIRKADLLIAVTDSDELNLLCCVVAKKVGSCNTIARVRDHAYLGDVSYLKDELGLAMVINPELAVAEEIARVLRVPSAINIETFSKGKIELVKFRLSEDSVLIGKSVKDVASEYKLNILFCTAERGGDVYITKGDFVFEAKDLVSVIAPPRSISAFFKKVSPNAGAIKNAMIVGGGETTHYLCTLCHGSGISLKVIDPNLDVCNELCSAFPEVTVVHGDTAEQETLMEEGIERTDAFVSLTDTDEENIILSLFAKERSHAKTVTKIKRIDFDEVIGRLNLDTVIYPKNLTADSIVRYARSMENTRGSNMESLYSIIKGKVEASEFIIKEGSPVIGKALSALRLKNNVLIAAILRGRSVIIPRGYDTIQAGDGVIVVSEVIGLSDISDILQ